MDKRSDVLCPPLQNEIRDRAKQGHRSIDAFKRVARSPVNDLELRVRGFKSVERRIGCLARTRVFSGSLAQLSGGCRNIQQIVGDLKQQTEIGRILSYRVEFTVAETGNDGAADARAVPEASPGNG